MVDRYVTIQEGSVTVKEGNATVQNGNVILDHSNRGNNRDHESELKLASNVNTLITAIPLRTMEKTH